jgi:hypothetical protein
LEKAEVEESSSEGTMEPSSEEATPYQSTFQSEAIETTESKDKEKLMGEMEQKFEELLRIIREETLQLSEFLVEEKKLTHELYVLLKPILKQLNTSFNIPTTVIPLTERAKQIFLNAEGHLILVDEKNRVSSKALEDCPPETILNVLWVVIPAISGAIVSYRKRVSFRVSLFNRVNRELKNLYKAFVKGQEKPEEDEETQKEKSQEDGVRKSLLSKQ